MIPLSIFFDLFNFFNLFVYNFFFKDSDMEKDLVRILIEANQPIPDCLGGGGGGNDDFRSSSASAARKADEDDEGW